MSELPLPEDVTRWPSDPFELLGVRRGSDEKELKRAYQRLLRVYRPERFPEEFRRLRDAYETAKMWSQWVTVRDEEETETAADGDVAVSATNLDRTSDDGAANATTSSEFPAPLRPRVPSYEDRLRDAGEAARDGRLIEGNRSHCGEQGRSSILAELGLHGLGQPVEYVAVLSATGLDHR